MLSLISKSKRKENKKRNGTYRWGVAGGGWEGAKGSNFPLHNK